MASEFETVELLGATAAKTNFSVDLAGGLADKASLGGHKTGVAWQILSIPVA